MYTESSAPKVHQPILSHTELPPLWLYKLWVKVVRTQKQHWFGYWQTPICRALYISLYLSEFLGPMRLDAEGGEFCETKKKVLSAGKGIARRRRSLVVRSHLPHWLRQPRCAWAKVRSCWGFSEICHLPTHFPTSVLFFLHTTFTHQLQSVLKSLLRCMSQNIFF